MWSALRAMCDVMWNLTYLLTLLTYSANVYVGPGLTSLGSR